MARVTITADWPRMEFLLWDFQFDSDILVAWHRNWLRQNIFPILGKVKVEIFFVGGASRIGSSRWNYHLAHNRMRSVAQFLNTVRPRRGVYSPRDELHWIIAGERAAGGGPDADRDEDRGVAMLIQPLGISRLQVTRDMVSRVSEQARRRIIREFKRLILQRHIPPESGESREAEWGPLRERLLGFGLRLELLLKNMPYDHRLPGPEFVDAITVRAPAPRAVEGERAARQRGNRDALRLWNAINPDARWGLKQESVQMELLRDLCSEFRHAYERYANSSQDWPIGACEFYSAEDERNNPLR